MTRSGIGDYMGDDKEPTFRRPDQPTREDLKRNAAADYVAYFRFHEERKELEAKRLKIHGYVPLRRRVKGRRVF